MSPAPRSISVLMPIKNGARFLDRVLSALARQRIDVPWDFMALDCGSTDGTLEIFERHAAQWPVPLRVHGIHGEEFNHGCARNLLAALSTGELLVFLTDDAIPMSDDWLASLAANYEDARVGAAYCRNITRPDADVLVRVFNQLDPAYDAEGKQLRLPPPAEYSAMGPDERRVQFNFCDTASSMRRELWERHPYPRCVFGEDVLIARAIMEGGYTVVFDAQATVEHSHDYDVAETLHRAKLDARFNAEWLGRVCMPTRKTARRLALEQVDGDRIALAGTGLTGSELDERVATARDMRLAHFEGLFEGGRARRRFRRTVLRDDPVGECWLVLDGEGSELDWRSWARAMADQLGELGHNAHLLGIDELGELPAGGALHFIAPGPRSLPGLSHALLEGHSCMVHLDPTALEHANVLEACRGADLALAPTRDLRKQLIEGSSFDPYQLAYSPCSGLHSDEQVARPRSARENALELAFRHQLLRARADEPPPGVLLDLPAGTLRRRECAVRDVGGGQLELDAGEWIELTLELPMGRHELDLYLAFASAPAGARMDGRVLVDGRPLARIGPLPGDGKRSTPIITIPLKHDSRCVRIEGGPLRITRLVVRRGGWRKLRPLERLQNVANRLSAFRRVTGPPPQRAPSV